MQHDQNPIVLDSEPPPPPKIFLSKLTLYTRCTRYSRCFIPSGWSTQQGEQVILGNATWPASLWGKSPTCKEVTRSVVFWKLEISKDFLDPIEDAD